MAELQVWRRALARFGSFLNPQSTALLKRLLTDQGLKHWKGYALSFAMLGVVAASTALSAWIIGSIVNDVFVEKNVAAVWAITVAIIVLYSIKGAATYGQQVALSRIANNVVADVQKRIFDQMLRMKVAYYANSHSTEFLAKQTFIARSASGALGLLVTTLGRDLLSMVGLVAVMVLRDPLLALIALIFVPGAAVAVRKISASARKVMGAQYQGGMAIMESLQETAQGIRIVKAFTLENFMRRRQTEAIEGFERSANRLSAVSSRTSPLMETLAGFAIAAVVLYGGLRVIYSGVSPGALFSFITSVIMSYEPMKRLARFQVDLNSQLFGVTMLYDFLDQRDEEREAPDEPELDVTAGRIEFRDVRFGYRPDEPVLRGASIVAEPGKTTALVGRSGGGKSTIMSLILRFYDVDAGEILIDGQDVRSVKRSSLRGRIAYVSQENFLFNGSVRDNIAVGRPDASAADIEAAAKAAYAHDFILGFERGYDTPCGEHGLQLSGGQRQRIAIARAFLKDAPVILLDEATSALDSESEQAIQKALEALCKGRTTLVIAHRLSTVVNADEICVVDRGRVVERGRHADLMAAGGVYYHIAKSQFPRDAA